MRRDFGGKAARQAAHERAACGVESCAGQWRERDEARGDQECALARNDKICRVEAAQGGDALHVDRHRLLHRIESFINQVADGCNSGIDNNELDVRRAEPTCCLAVQLPCAGASREVGDDRLCIHTFSRYFIDELGLPWPWPIATE